MYSCDVSLPSHLTFILNVIMGDFLWQKNHVDEKEDALEAIDSSRKEFKSFLNDPVKLSELQLLTLKIGLFYQNF